MVRKIWAPNFVTATAINAKQNKKKIVFGWKKENGKKKQSA